MACDSTGAWDTYAAGAWCDTYAVGACERMVGAWEINVGAW